MIEIAKMALGKILYSDGPNPILNRSCFGVLRHEQLREWEHEGVELDLVLEIAGAAPGRVQQAKRLHIVDLQRESALSASAAFHFARENTDLANLFWDFESADLKKQLAQLTRAELLAHEDQIKAFAIEKRKRILVFAGEFGPLSIITKPAGPFLDTLAMSWVIRLSDDVFAIGTTRCDFGVFRFHNDEVTRALNDLHDFKKTLLVRAHRFLEALPPDELDLEATYVRIKEEILDAESEKLRGLIAVVKNALDKERKRSAATNPAKSKGKGAEKQPPEWRSSVPDAALNDPQVNAKVRQLDRGGVLGIAKVEAAGAIDSEHPSGAAAEEPSDPEEPNDLADTLEVPGPTDDDGFAEEDGVFDAAISEQELEEKAIKDKAFATWLSRKLAASNPRFDAMTERQKEMERTKLAKEAIRRLDLLKVLKHYFRGKITEKQLLTLSEEELIALGRRWSYILISQTPASAKAEEIRPVCCENLMPKAQGLDETKFLTCLHCKHQFHTEHKCAKMFRVVERQQAARKAAETEGPSGPRTRSGSSATPSSSSALADPPTDYFAVLMGRGRPASGKRKRPADDDEFEPEPNADDEPDENDAVEKFAAPEKSWKMQYPCDYVIVPGMTQEQHRLLVKNHVFRRVVRRFIENESLPLVINKIQIDAMVAKEVLDTPDDVHSATFIQFYGIDFLTKKLNCEKAGKGDRRVAALANSYGQTVENRVLEYAMVHGFTITQSERPRVKNERDRSGINTPIPLYCFSNAEHPAPKKFAQLERKELLRYKHLMGI
ncbi:hypothetical protein DFJ74DRAFT_299367 [Hyaloraphidium curvatum]|nr:hypothetical protein DFJ74DRAFT_299367 [Hyaloraphidium curvatum]